MNNRADEKILDYINEMEKREARKDIHNGPVEIGDRYYEFEERGFFEEKFKIFIPKEFNDMSLGIRKLKYPSESRPEVIKSNEEGSIDITLRIIDNLVDEEHVGQLRDIMKLMNKRLNPANLYFDEGILEINEKNIGYFDFKSSAIDGFLYNFIFLMEFQQKTLMGTFSCPYGEHKQWKDVIFEIMNTIKVIK